MRSSGYAARRYLLPKAMIAASVSLERPVSKRKGSCAREKELRTPKSDAEM